MTHTFKATALVLATAIPTIAVAQGDLTRAQYAENIGVDAEKFTLNELVQLDADLKDNNSESVNMLLESAGSDLTYEELRAGMSSTEAPTAAAVGDAITAETGATMSDDDMATGGKEQIAGELGVDADDFSLNELVALRKAVRDENVEGIQVILDGANVNTDPRSLL